VAQQFISFAYGLQQHLLTETMTRDRIKQRRVTSAAIGRCQRELNEDRSSRSAVTSEDV